MAKPNSLRLSSFNCRSIKSSLSEMAELCERSDFVLVQEHWLLPFEIGELNNVHPSFLASGKSAVDVSTSALIGRPYGGTAILFRKDLSGCISTIETHDPRITAVRFTSSIGPVFIACVYMPCDMGDHDSLENFMCTCCKLNSLYDESDVVHAIIAGDFNCQSGSRFFKSFLNCARDSKLELSDLKRLCDVFTFCSDDGLRSSWIDHILCSSSIDGLIAQINILHEYISSDHKPLLVTLDGIRGDMLAVNRPQQCSSPSMDWTKADAYCINSYQLVLNEALSHVDIPVDLLCKRDVNCTTAIDNYYCQIITCIINSCLMSIPYTNKGSYGSDYVVAGWNEIVDDKHKAARAAFLDWVAVGRPRHGPVFMLMSRTRAAFKLALRYCKDHEVMMQANAHAKSLSGKDFKGFWNGINKQNNAKSTKHATVVNGCSDVDSICDMWHDYFKNLYNSVQDSHYKNLLYSRLAQRNSEDKEFKITVHDIVDCLSKQKLGKAAGLDGIPMEAIIHGGHKLHIHLCLLFNIFLQVGYLPRPFMQAVIIPLVKNKAGDLSNVNNYRAITISTCVSKLFESVIAKEVFTNDDCDKHQFGFKSHHSTGLCTHVFKQTVDYYVNRGSHVFASFIDFTKAFDCVNYWKLFNKLLDDKIDMQIVKLLTYWYTRQELCVRWITALSSFFSIGNGTRQGGVLSPYLFNRYIRELLRELEGTLVGCCVGNMLVNVLAYADDIVLLAPSWRGLQCLLSLLEKHSVSIDLTCNVKKTVCMVFSPKQRYKVIASVFPQFSFNNNVLQFVKEFKYLGHIITDNLTDNADIDREIRNLFVRTNILLRRFYKCSINVKRTLFQAYCICLYDTALWSNYNLGSIRKLASCYNKCVKLFFGYKRYDSVTKMLCETGIPSFDTVLHNSLVSFSRCWQVCSSYNEIVKYFVQLRSWL